MKKMVITALLAALVSISAGAQSNLKKIYDEQIDPVEQIDKAIAKARKEGKHVRSEETGADGVLCSRISSPRMLKSTR